MWRFLINPRRACARVTVVCLCVYPSVPTLAASASVETSKQRYSRVCLRLFLDFDSWIFEKTLPLKRYGVKKQMSYIAHREPFSHSFGTNETQHLREGQLVGRMLLRRATGMKQARYRREPLYTRAARHSYAHAQYIHSVRMCMWALAVGVMPASSACI